jgi:uncharacterized membrane protein YphA (DoxX/SURF4 family)
MPKHTKPDTIQLLLMVGRILLGALFIYASWDKLFDPAAFAAIVANYQILPSMLVNAVALGLPWLELVCGIGLMTNCWTRGCALMVVLLMVVFIAAMGYNMYHGIDVTCGCFTLTGTAPQSMWVYLLRDVILLALAITILMLPKAHTPIMAIFKPDKTNGDADRHAI